MSWIATIPPEKATGRLKEIYQRVTSPGERVDNILQVHSLRPHTLHGHMALYKNVLHHSSNTLPKWFLETIGVYVSLLNECAYCVEHHYAGLQRLLADNPDRAARIRRALETNKFADTFEPAQMALLEYARKLAIHPSQLTEEDIRALRNHAIPDGEILEVNQVTAYFCYANRTVLGLGVTTVGDILGLSPGNSEDPEDWGHH